MGFSVNIEISELFVFFYVLFVPDGLAPTRTIAWILFHRVNSSQVVVAENDDRKDTVGIWLQHEDRHLTSDIRIHSVTTISLVSVEFFWIFVLSARCSSQMFNVLHCEGAKVLLEVRFWSQDRDLISVFFLSSFSCQTDWHRLERLQGFFFIVLTAHKLLLRRMTIGKIQWESDFNMKTDISTLTSDSSAWQTHPCQ